MLTRYGSQPVIQALKEGRDRGSPDQAGEVVNPGFKEGEPGSVNKVKD